jgi:hypothetical protein
VSTSSPCPHHLAQQRVRDLASALASGHGARATVEIRRGEPVLVNDAGMVRLGAEAAADVTGRTPSWRSSRGPRATILPSDEGALALGAATLVRAAPRFLTGP